MGKKDSKKRGKSGNLSSPLLEKPPSHDSLKTEKKFDKSRWLRLDEENCFEKIFFRGYSRV